MSECMVLAFVVIFFIIYLFICFALSGLEGNDDFISFVRG